MRRRHAALVLASLLGACAGGPASPDAPPSAEAPEPAADYLVVAPPEADAALAPLLALRRAQGHTPKVLRPADLLRGGGPTALVGAVDAMRADPRLPPSRTRFVLIVGEAELAPARLGEWASGLSEPFGFASDHVYERLDPPRVAVGRLPARSLGALEAAVGKIVRYEAHPPGAWQRRVLVFGGPADFGPLADALIEGEAAHLLDELLPHAFDVGVVFAKASSPFTYRFDRLGQKIVGELNEGALVAVYAGHGSPQAFDDAYYRGYAFPIGTRSDLAGVDVRAGAPLFVSLTCSTGRFGDTIPSLGEELALSPGGPVAVFASADVSHPYPNLLFGQALLDVLLVQRSPTLGEGVLAAKQGMLDLDLPLAGMLVPGDLAAIKRDHLFLYNLLGDPATPLRYPRALALPPLRSPVGPAEIQEITVAAPLPDGATVELRVELERSAIKDGQLPPDRLEALPLEQAFAAMEKNHAIAEDKLVTRTSGTVKDGAVRLSVSAPSAPGRYWVKVHATATDSDLAGAAALEVR